MAATVYGKAYVYGTASLTSPTNSDIQSATLGKSDANVSEVAGSGGGIETLRTDDQRDELELELKITASFSEPAIGSVLEVEDSATPGMDGEYIVKTTNLQAQTKDFKTFKVTATRYEYINPTP